MTTERLAQLHRDGLISDRDLYLGKDNFTVVEKGSSEASYLLAPVDTLISAEHVTRLGLEIAGGKIVQKKEGAKGGPEAGLTPQSAAEPPAKPVMEAHPAAPTLQGFEAKKDVAAESVSGPELDPRSGLPKSDPRFIPTGGNMPPAKEARAVPPKDEEKVVREAERAREAEVAEAAKSAPRQARPSQRQARPSR